MISRRRFATRSVLRGAGVAMRVAAALWITPILADAAPPYLDGKAIPTREVVRFDAPLSERQQKLAKIGDNPPVALASCGIAVPVNFDPAKATGILLWNSSQNQSAVEELPALAPIVTDAGWLLLAADGRTAANVETTEWSVAMAGAAFDHLERSWPSVKRWPVAVAGFSGGGKRAAYVAASLMESRYRVIGMFMGGVNENRAADALRWHRPGPAYQQVPIFFSAGREDRAVNLDAQDAVMDSFKSSGFTRARRENFNGPHELHLPHLTEALKWFANPQTGTP